MATMENGRGVEFNLIHLMRKQLSSAASYIRTMMLFQLLIDDINTANI
jgi:hypothetical protein